MYGQSWGYGQGGVGLSIARLALGGGYGNGGYGYSPIGWGLGGWGLGSLGYGSGYLSYSNPYYVAGGAGIYNYAQPIPVAYNTVAAAVVNPDVQTADDVLNAAVAAFQANDYPKALDLVDGGIRQYPDDSVLHEFRGLVLFAKQDYQQSAATIHAVLAVGPGWNWTTLSGLYGQIGLYTTQLRALEAYAKQNSNDSAARFLLAYHYMVGGHNEAVAAQLRQVVRLTPNDRVAADLLRMVAAPPPLQAEDPAKPPIPVTTPEKAIPAVVPAALVGSWNAVREGGAKFTLLLDQDANFKWGYTQDKQPGSQFAGKYTLEGNVLALERANGGLLIALVTPGSNGTFNFRLVGAPSEDPGLDFTR